MEEKKLRVLVISRSPWIENNNTGSTLSNFFSDLKEIDFFGLCLREAPKVSSICKSNFYISEGQLLRSLLNKNEIVGKITNSLKFDNDACIKEKDFYDKVKKTNSSLLKIFREILWSISKWKNSNLNEYLNLVHPDIIFFPSFPCAYPCKILKYIYEKTKAKVIIFHSDDCYTLKQFSLSPFFWIFRLYQRKWIKKAVSFSSRSYVISDIQKKDYDKCFKLNHLLLTKSYNFNDAFFKGAKVNSPLQMVYTGNLEMKRWKNLLLLIKCLKQINKEEIKVRLLVYSPTHLSKRIIKRINTGNYSSFKGSVDPSLLPSIQMNADLLVHVESFDLINRLKVRQSFSTKIVDYLISQKPIFAIGPLSIASISYLKKHKCGFVSCCRNDINDNLFRILDNPSLLSECSKKELECGKEFHDSLKMKKMILNDFMTVIGINNK